MESGGSGARTPAQQWDMLKRGGVAAAVIFGSLLIFSEIGDARLAMWIAAAIFLAVVITGPTGGPGRALIRWFTGAIDRASNWTSGG